MSGRTNIRSITSETENNSIYKAMLIKEKKGAYVAPEVQVTDFEMEVSVLQSSTEDLFDGDPLN